MNVMELYQSIALEPIKGAFIGLAKQKLIDLLTQGYRINGFAIARDVEGSDPQRGFITVDGLVCWWTPGLQALERAHEAMEKLRVRCEQAEAVERERDELRAQVEALTKPQEPVAYWIPKAEQFCIADPGGRPFAKAWEPLYSTPSPLTRPAVPEGWNIKMNDDGEVMISSPVSQGPGCLTVGFGGGLAQRMLHSLCRAILGAPQPEAQPTEAAQKGGV